MKITKKLEAEILHVMEEYWGSYLNGDLQTWASYLPNDYRNIGTTQAEIWNSKKEIVDFTEKVLDQMVGMAEARNKKTQIIPYDPYIMVHELGDLYVKAEEGWIFYAQIRLSSLLEKTADRWKILHQHGSYPDSKTEEGEFFAFDEIRAENKKLRDAIKSRTLELEQKNRELEIEAALERVRTVAMSMKTPKTLQAVGEVIFKELKGLGFSDLRNTEIIINQDEKQSILSYYYSDYGVSGETEVDYTAHPVLQKWAVDLKTAGDGFASVHISEREMEGWKQYRETLGQLPDPKLEQAKTLDYYSYSTGSGALAISSFKPISSEQLATLERFRNVFGLAYRRYMDVVQAEAQAREAQIEAALERVRSASLAMHHTSELQQVINAVHQQLSMLDIPITGGAFIAINEENKKEWVVWGAGGSADMVARVQIPFLDKPIYSESIRFMQSGPGLYTEEYSYEEKMELFSHLFKHPPFSQAPAERKKELMSRPGGYTRSCAVSKNTSVFIINHHGRIFSKDENEILQRIARVFEQSYTRFLDLQKAEAQAREAQIEAALEKVRSRSLAVNEVDEFNDVVGVVFEKLSELDIPANTVTIMVYKGDSLDYDVFGSAVGETGLMTVKFELPYFNTPMLDDISQVRSTSEEGYFSKVYSYEEKNHYYEFAFKNTELKNLPDDLKQQVWQSKAYAISAAYAKNSMIGVNDFEGNVLGADQADIIKRFSRVFEQAYIRFLDLQRAEAQAREAQIEAALERVRARTMAMQDSTELAETAMVLFEQLRKLDSNLWSCGFVLCEKDNPIDEQWMSVAGGGLLPPQYIPHEHEATHYNMYKSWEDGNELYSEVLEGERLREMGEFLMAIPSVRKNLEQLMKAGFEFPPYQKMHAARFSNGYLLIITIDDFKDTGIFIRFAKVFDQTYTRFLDLKRAEEQAKESKIQLALERVRARTMAMHKTDELQEVVRVVAEELKNTGVILDTWGAVICTYFQDSNDVLHWTAAEDPANPSIAFLLPYFRDDLYDEAWASKNRGDSYFAKVFSFEVKNAFFKHAFEHSDYRYLPDDYKKSILESENHGIAWAWAKNSAIMIPSVQGDLPSEEEKEILIRFAKVFEQAYVRFMDLQKAEKQAKEARKQAALDRVRGEIASMRSTEDLNRITPVIWRELTSLDVPFIRCGVFIVDEKSEVVEVYLTTPEGQALGVLHLPIGVNTQATNIVKYWKEKKVYREHWDAPTFIEWTQSMIEMGQVKNFTDYQGSAKIPDELHLHFVPFNQGMLYVGDVNPLQEEKIELVKTLAEAFSMAYARYEDFARLEHAKSKVEAALAELKATQAQLIHSEKMASLGELTAGIAHEIQNPLNFVNNFSEVTNELLEEMKEEIEKGDLEEAKALADDIKKNLEKIHHHGGRADAIVKGMLQHSRQSIAEKTATDINKLADEYLRLAYHGLRAKDKSFNATLNTDFDPALEPITVIPQDIGRVILNLITNAFYAVQEKKKSNGRDYLPTVTICTKKTADAIIISVKDNGDGIPQKVLDKIFQPFFTTKPTGQGTGLGLSLSYDIVKAHEGKLEVETEEGKHTIFKIILPKQNK